MGNSYTPAILSVLHTTKTEHKLPYSEGANSLRPLIEGDAPTMIMKPDREVRD